MSLPFSLLLALKYLRPKRNFLSVVTVLSVLGVLLGVAVLLIVISVMTGFDDMWREKTINFDAHLTVTSAGGEAMENEAELLAKIDRVPGVVGAAPCVQGLVLMLHHNRVFTPMVRGIDPVRERRISRIPQSIIAGTFSVKGNDAVIGADLARRMGVQVGSKLLVYSPQNFAAADELRLPEEFVVAGIFEIGMWKYDIGFLLTSLEKARDLYKLDRGVHALRVMTADEYMATDTARALTGVLGPEYLVETWMDTPENQELFSALRVEKKMMFFLLIFITLVAAFGITNTLITVTVQKTREIGLLMALGFQAGSIMRVFIWQGLIQGLLGTALGLGAGWLVLHYRNDLMRRLSEILGEKLLPKALYGLGEIPSHTAGADVTVIAVCGVAICTLAALIPAYRAARLNPVEALRYE